MGSGTREWERGWLEATWGLRRLHEFISMFKATDSALRRELTQSLYEALVADPENGAKLRELRGSSDSESNSTMRTERASG